MDMLGALESLVKDIISWEMLPAASSAVRVNVYSPSSVTFNGLATADPLRDAEVVKRLSSVKLKVIVKSFAVTCPSETPSTVMVGMVVSIVKPNEPLSVFNAPSVAVAL